jgi:hypothetical protein
VIRYCGNAADPRQITPDTVAMTVRRRQFPLEYTNRGLGLPRFRDAPRGAGVRQRLSLLGRLKISLSHKWPQPDKATVPLPMPPRGTLFSHSDSLVKRLRAKDTPADARVAGAAVAAAP